MGGEAAGEHLPLEWAEQEDALFGAPESVRRLLGAITPEWLRTQRWFRGKAREVVAVEAADYGALAPGGPERAAGHSPRPLRGGRAGSSTCSRSPSSRPPARAPSRCWW